MGATERRSRGPSDGAWSPGSERQKGERKPSLSAANGVFPAAVNELATIKKIVMIYEKFEPKNYAKTRMKIARVGAALVREAPKPQRPLWDLRLALLRQGAALGARQRGAALGRVVPAAGERSPTPDPL